MYYQSGREGGAWALLRAFVEVDRATMGPERLAAKLTASARLHNCLPTSPVRRRPALGQEPAREAWRRHYPIFPRLLFVLDGTGPAGVTTRLDALHTAATDLTLTPFLHTVPVLAAALADLRTNGVLPNPCGIASRTPTT